MCLPRPGSWLPSSPGHWHSSPSTQRSSGPPGPGCNSPRVRRENAAESLRAGDTGLGQPSLARLSQHPEVRTTCTGPGRPGGLSQVSSSPLTSWLSRSCVSGCVATSLTTIFPSESDTLQDKARHSWEGPCPSARAPCPPWKSPASRKNPAGAHWYNLREALSVGSTTESGMAGLSSLRWPST